MTTRSKDGRINSSIDENKIIDLLVKKFYERLYIPRTRMWYDLLVHDILYGWIPVNIKITTMLTSDNTGNLAMCVHSYTDMNLDLHKSYNNGVMSKVLIRKLGKKELCAYNKQDYYFIVVNKNNTKDIIINSLKGLTILTANSNNLPFQICWNKNREFLYTTVFNNVKLFVQCLQKPQPSWKELFMLKIRTIDV